MIIDYQKKMEDIIGKINNQTSKTQRTRENAKRSLLLHSCCAPCSSYVIKYLVQYFQITVFYYNINIFPASEYNKRVLEQERFINQLNCEFGCGVDYNNQVDFDKIILIKGDYNFEKFFEISQGLEHEPEGGKRCRRCYLTRLEETAKMAKKNNYDYFTTTLTISPYKNAILINQIGQELEKKYGVKYLYSDFKKKEGYKKSIEMSKKYNLYRQNYCGCIFSQKQNEQDEK